MYEDSYRRQPRRQRRRRRPGGCLIALLLRLILLVVVLAVASAAILYALPPALFAVEPEGEDLSLTDGLPSSRANVLLIGVDVLRESSQRSDTIMIASIGYDKLRVASVLRDTVMDIPGRKATKVNAAFAYGGPTLLMKTLNENLRLNLMHYVVVDFVALVKVVDAMGGVDIDISEAEMQQINRNVYSSRKVFRPLGYTATELTTFGENTHLTGLQALGYARIRKLDSDYMRTSRQRRLVKAMAARLRTNAWNPTMWLQLIRVLPEVVHTNMSPVQLLSLAEKAILARDYAQMRLPVDDSFTDNGSSLKVTDFPANTRAFLDFAYN